MICPECREAGLKSRVDLKHTDSNLDMAARPWWDEDERFHIHDATTRTTTYACSMGHRWDVTSDLQPCPQGDYP